MKVQIVKTLTEQFGELGTLVVEVWNTSFFGISLGKVILAVSLVVLALLVRGFFTRHVLRILSRMARKTKTDFDDHLFEAIAPPFKLLPLIVGLFFAIQVLGLSGSAQIFGANVMRSLIAYAIFWALVRSVEPVFHLMDPLKNTLSPAILDWTKKAAKTLFAFIGGAAILEIWGIQVGPMLAGLGIFGVAVALGAQDLFKNLIAGILILAERRFNPGEWIKVDGVVEGTAEKINFRSTQIRRFDKSIVHVPNALLSDNSLTNFSRMTHRRIYWKIGLVYGSTVEQLRAVQQGILEYIQTHDDFAQPPEVSTFVHIDSFNESSIDLMIYCFTKTTNWGEWLEIKEDFVCAVKEIVAKAGTDFAFPSRTIYVEQSGEPGGLGG
ncbi:MAG: mechanosensitive ion channel family protein [Robiginitomaculum sp.]|nr:mechanosensitive ion channel family protein [Robiginitomaculum sp.]MDQ7077634.1 mechanosensitive ion channel family protein [Robiginitomaculum sp.]